MSEFFVEIRPRSEDETDPGFRRMGPMRNEEAVMVDRDANRNLNHRSYYTRIVSAKHGHGWRSEQGLKAERAALDEDDEP